VVATNIVNFTRQQQVAPDTASLHTPTMTLKNAALLALMGTILATVLLTWTFIMTALNVLRGLTPPLILFPWFIYAFACFSVAVFFYVFHRAQS
jgi:amino acid transporter